MPDHELVGMVLDSADGSLAVESISRSIFSRFSGRSLSPVSPDELCSACGLSLAMAARLSAAIELARRLLLPDEGRGPVRSPRDACRFVSRIRGEQKEHFIALCLNARNMVIHEETVSIGSLNANIVHPREVFRPAIAHSAAAVVLAHNHPSGDVSPSQEDLRLTSRMVEAGRVIGIEVLDHIIVSRSSYLSFRSESYL
jgi:DNA repair protein RadC